MKKIHFTDRYLLNPRHPVTVFVIGAGGTGSQVITNLARMSMALQALGHPGLYLLIGLNGEIGRASCRERV